MDENKVTFQFPTELVELPSKGLVYDKNNPLSKGTVEMKYMSAREEDIITNQNYIQKNLVGDKLIQSLIIDKNINYKTLLISDKDALLVAARVLGYGKDYSFTYGGEEHTVDLSQLENKSIDESYFTNQNEYSFTFPHSGTNITFQYLTLELDDKIENELRGIGKIKKGILPEVSTRMKYIIKSVEGDYDFKNIREFVDNFLLAKDAKALRDHIAKTQPGIKFTFNRETYSGEIEEVDIPFNSDFFFPN